ncbi:MAG TPA: hypothetical protein VEG39_05625 [Clostridia bacterium]|nr:hypothetical protein [Clostridia bacterium]
MEILKYTHIFYFAITWLFVFIFIRPKRILELIPIAVLGVITLTIVDIYITSLNLYQYNKPLINVLGAPLFHLLWGGGAGIVYIHYMKPGFVHKFVNVVLFTIITLALEFISEQAGVAQRLGSYSFLHSALLDFAALVVLLWIAEGLYGSRIYKKQ